MANKPGEANFFPDVTQFPSMGTFQPVYGKFDLTTYIQGASDYEIMAFLVGKYNACLEAYGNITKLSTDTITACKQLQDWINSWFTNLDVQEEINNKLDSMVANGSFGTLLHKTFDTQINQQTTSAVTAWLVANVTPTGSTVVVDKSLTIEGAAADAKATGTSITNTFTELATSFAVQTLASNLVKNYLVGYAINIDTGKIYKFDDKYSLTNFIPVSGYKKINAYFPSTSNHTVYFFDKNKQLISHSDNAGSYNYEFNIPENAITFMCATYTAENGKELIYIDANENEKDFINTMIVNDKTLKNWDKNITPGTFVNNYTGEIENNDRYFTTTKIPINGTLIIHAPYAINHSYVVYDYAGNKLYYGYFTSDMQDFEFTAEHNGKYLVVTFENEEYDSAYIINKEFSKALFCNSLGDSITMGHYNPGGGFVVMENPYPKLIGKNENFATCRNYGVSGSTLSGGTNSYEPMSVRYNSMNNNANVITVMGGVNDYMRGTILGTIEDTTIDTIYGGLDVLANGLITKFPKALIIFATPIRKRNCLANNSQGYNLQDVANAIKAVANKYGIQILDLFNNGNFFPDNTAFANIYTTDGIHPNPNFVEEHLAPSFIGGILRNYN